MRKLDRLTQSGREGDLARKRVLQFLRHRVHHRRVEDTRRDRNASNAEPRELTCDGQCHSREPRLRGGIGRLADLAFKRGDGRGVNDQPALAVLGGRIVLHDLRRRLVAQEGADEVDVYDFGEEVAGHRSVLAEHAARTHHTGAIHQQVDAVHLAPGAFHRRIHFGFGGHVTSDEQGVGTKSGGGSTARPLLHVQDDDLAALRHDVLSNRVAQAGSPARYDGACILNLHSTPLETPYPIISTANATASPPPIHREVIPRFPPRRRRA